MSDPSSLCTVENYVDNVDLSDTQLVQTVRKALTSVKTVSVVQVLLLPLLMCLQLYIFDAILSVMLLDTSFINSLLMTGGLRPL